MIVTYVNCGRSRLGRMGLTWQENSECEAPQGQWLVTRSEVLIPALQSSYAGYSRALVFAPRGVSELSERVKIMFGKRVSQSSNYIPRKEASCFDISETKVALWLEPCLVVRGVLV